MGTSGGKDRKETTGQYSGVQFWYGNTAGDALSAALNDKIRYHHGKFPIPMQSKSTDGKRTDIWLLCYRKSKHNTNGEQIEIWAGDSNGDWECAPMFRLYPNPSQEYLD